MSWWSRFSNVLRSGRLQDELDEEQRFHIESRAEELETEGRSRQDALALASRQFGNRLILREASRDVKLFPWLESLWRDLRLGARMLRNEAAVSSAAVTSLALAIGACAAAFSLIDALILRQLPVPEPNQLVYLTRSATVKQKGVSSTFSYPFFDRVRRTVSPQMETFSLSEQSPRQALLPDTGGVEEKLVTQFVSGNAFDALRVTPAMGRMLGRSDDVAGTHPAAVISYAFWKRRLGEKPSVLGLWIQVEQKPYEIVGVARAGFTGTQPGVLTDIWIPNMVSRFADSVTNPNWGWLQVWGRLLPGASREALQPIVRTALTNLDQDKGGKARGQQAVESAIDVVDASTGLSHVRQDFQRPLLALAAIVGLVLLIASSNVANLLLARGAARSREMAVRASIGAGRARLLQHALAESSVLTLTATALGVLGALLAVPLIVSMLSTNENPVYLEARLDWRVLLFVAALGSVTTILFGLAPALRASAASAGEAIVCGNQRHTARAGMARSLLAAQIAFSLTVVFVAALLLRSFDRLLAVDLGFTPGRVTLLSVEARERFAAAEAREVSRQLIERVQSMPGVESASLSAWALFRGWSWGHDVEIPGRGFVDTHRLAVSHSFFQTMAIRVLDGREFVPQDAGVINPIPVVVNAAFARRYFPGERAVGKRLTTTNRGEVLLYEIVGVTADARDGSVRGETSPYLFSMIGDAAGTLEIRSSLDARTLADYLRRELPRVHSSLRLVDVTLQSSLVGNTLLRERLLAVLSGFFGAIGLILAGVGLYGVLSYAVARRTREIGIRLALGAQAPAVVRAVAARVALALGIGVVAGLAAGVYFARFVQTFLFEIDPVSVSSLGWPVLGLLGVSLVATWAPLRRAIHIDPVYALRAE
jgi:predicted permease